MVAHPHPDAARERQARHTSLLGFGAPAVERAAAARVAVVGAGGLGCPALRVLAASGLARLTIIDDDRVERSNLARQTLYTERDLGRRKAEAAVEALRDAAPATELRAVVDRLDAGNAVALLRGADVVLDTTDDWPTRFAVADACRELRIPLVWGSVLGWDGLLTTFAPSGPGLDDLVDRATQLTAPPRDCATAGVFAPLCAEIGAAMAGEGLRIGAGLAPLLVGRVRSWDAAGGGMRELPLRAGARHPASRTDGAPSRVDDADGAPSRVADAEIAPGSPGEARRSAGASTSSHADAHQPAVTTTTGSRPATALRRVTVDGLPDGAIVVDVRPASHPALDPARRLDYRRVPLEWIAEAGAVGAVDELLPLDRPLVVACTLGPRARHAAELLRDAGAETLVLDGGVPALAARNPAASRIPAPSADQEPR